MCGTLAGMAWSQASLAEHQAGSWVATAGSLAQTPALGAWATSCHGLHRPSGRVQQLLEQLMTAMVCRVQQPWLVQTEAALAQ